MKLTPEKCRWVQKHLQPTTVTHSCKLEFILEQHNGAANLTFTRERKPWIQTDPSRQIRRNNSTDNFTKMDYLCPCRRGRSVHISLFPFFKQLRYFSHYNKPITSTTQNRYAGRNHCLTLPRTLLIGRKLRQWQARHSLKSSTRSWSTLHYNTSQTPGI